eukprot:g1846.t1
MAGRNISREMRVERMKDQEVGSQNSRCASFSPDSSKVVVGTGNPWDRRGEVKLLDLESGQCELVLTVDAGVCRVAFSPDGKSVAAASGNTVQVRNVARGNNGWHTRILLKGHQKRVWSLAFSPDSTRIASASEDKTIRIWNAETGVCTDTLEGHKQCVNDVSFSPDGKMIASASSDWTARLWDVTSEGRWQYLKTLKGHDHRVSSVFFASHPNNSTPRLASASVDKTVKLWDVTSEECTQTLNGHSQYVRSISMSPDGAYIASGSTDGTVKLWDAKTGKCLTLDSDKSGVYNVSFSPDGAKLVACSGTNKISVFKIRNRTLEFRSFENTIKYVGRMTRKRDAEGNLKVNQGARGLYHNIDALQYIKEFL